MSINDVVYLWSTVLSGMVYGHDFVPFTLCSLAKCSLIYAHKVSTLMADIEIISLVKLGPARRESRTAMSLPKELTRQCLICSAYAL